MPTRVARHAHRSAGLRSPLLLAWALWATDLALMVTAALTIAVGARFAFKGGRFALRAIGLDK